MDRGELTVVNVVSPNTLAGMQNPNSRQDAVGERKISTEAESIAISLNDLQAMPQKALNLPSGDKEPLKID